MFWCVKAKISFKSDKDFSIEDDFWVMSSNNASEKSVVIKGFVRAAPKDLGWSEEDIFALFTLSDSFFYASFRKLRKINQI